MKAEYSCMIEEVRRDEQSHLALHFPPCKIELANVKTETSGCVQIRLYCRLPLRVRSVTTDQWNR